MTIQANDRRKEYQGNGVADTFNGPRAFSVDHILVYFRSSGSTEWIPVPGSQYLVKGVMTDQTRIVFTIPPAVSTDILILRTVPYDQDTDITNQGPFLPELHENAFDKRVMQIQQLADGSMILIFDPEIGDFVWDAKGHRIIRVGDGIAEMDAVNMRTLWTYVESVLSGGGGVGVNPLFWDWVGDGATADIPIPGADVGDVLMYDTAQEVAPGSNEYLVLRPNQDFAVIVGDDATESILRLAAAPPAGVRGFTTLRGYARPYTGPTPITTVAPRIVEVYDSVMVDSSFHNTLIVVNSPADVVVTIRSNTGAAGDWKHGEFFSVLQHGTGKVALVMESDGVLVPSPGFATETRGQGSIVSATTILPTADTWAVSGDLLRNIARPDYQCIALDDRAVLISVDIVPSTGRTSFVMPYGFLLNDIAARGLYASLAVAQSSGSPLVVDVNRNGTSILSTKLSFDNGETTTLLASVPAVFVAGGNLLYEGDTVTIDVDQVGVAGARGLTVYLVGQRAS